MEKRYIDRFVTSVMSEGREITHIERNVCHEWMKYRGRTKICRGSEDIHIIMAAFPQLHPPAAIPLSDPSPPVLWSDLLDPNENCAECKICVADFTAHRDNAVTVCAGVFVKEVSQCIKLFLDGLPGLVPLFRSKLGGGLLGLRPQKVSTAALREPEMSHGDHDGEERFREDFLYVVNEETLESTRSFGKDRSSGVGVFEVFGYVIGVGERFPATGIEDDGEGINWPTI